MSFIDHDKKILFIHVPKTGGTSMSRRKFLQPREGWHTDVGYFYNKYTNKNLDEYFKFAFVRSPYDRFLSATIGWIIPDKFNDISNEDEELCAELNDYISKNFNSFDYAENALRTQSSFLVRSSRVGVDFLGRFENMKEDWKKICKTLGETSHLSHVNKSGIKSYEGILDKTSIKLINIKYALDFEVFDYEML